MPRCVYSPNSPPDIDSLDIRGDALQDRFDGLDRYTCDVAVELSDQSWPLAKRRSFARFCRDLPYVCSVLTILHMIVELKPGVSRPAI
jgi:hypothetical protein